MMERIQVTKLGQIQEADIVFGDMTIFVGEQATGKSILLQLVKLIVDADAIIHHMKDQGLDWEKKREDFLQLYFGEGMQQIWDSEATTVTFGPRVDQQKFSIDAVINKYQRQKEESLFLIPAQRAAMLKNGWPPGFADYDVADPYVVKQFSERLRRLMRSKLGSGKKPIFPRSGRMDKALETAIGESVFPAAEVKQRSGLQRRIMLELEGGELPFMVWSAGQREFMPLLLGLYVLMPLRKTKNEKYNWVVIEEPEVGLHPKAISVVLAVFLELMRRGYKIIVSTHSSQVLELVWGIRHLVKANAEPTALLKMLGLESTPFLERLAQTTLKKKFNTYYFSRQGDGVKVQNISTLDAEDRDEVVSDFGGLTAFSTKVSEIVSEAMWRGNS